MLFGITRSRNVHYGHPSPVHRGSEKGEIHVVFQIFNGKPPLSDRRVSTMMKKPTESQEVICRGPRSMLLWMLKNVAIDRQEMDIPESRIRFLHLYDPLEYILATIVSVPRSGPAERTRYRLLSHAGITRHQVLSDRIPS